ncbi:uncharacterized protein LY89DRAFT_677608 [Mollisia scopiformis]|uniref:Uncharacterized protein n=1 Tax=Mollisia scopiformis TaxID=149040 RepID=A0A132B6F0_MOLSC|nr:uncharacterized protein LY89DRAFT_677608 [Mollisia scopiformis]KUJ07833.1 hypothetical protein LY89DRAFT_677608 [Mollisia scopiformis]
MLRLRRPLMKSHSYLEDSKLRLDHMTYRDSDFVKKSVSKPSHFMISFSREMGEIQSLTHFHFCRQASQLVCRPQNRNSVNLDQIKLTVSNRSVMACSTVGTPDYVDALRVIRQMQDGSFKLKKSVSKPAKKSVSKPAKAKYFGTPDYIAPEVCGPMRYSRVIARSWWRDEPPTPVWRTHAGLPPPRPGQSPMKERCWSTSPGYRGRSRIRQRTQQISRTHFQSSKESAMIRSRRSFHKPGPYARPSDWYCTHLGARWLGTWRGAQMSSFCNCTRWGALYRYGVGFSEATPVILKALKRLIEMELRLQNL